MTNPTNRIAEITERLEWYDVKRAEFDKHAPADLRYLIDDNERLRKANTLLSGIFDLIDKLPKTADGVPVVPGMRVYYNSLSPISATEGNVVSSVEFWERTSEGDFNGTAWTEDERDPNSGGPLCLPDDFGLYSTRAAAEASALADKEVEAPMPCGHPASEVISGDEGTNYCGACEREAQKEDTEYYENALGQEDKA